MAWISKRAWWPESRRRRIVLSCGGGMVLVLMALLVGRVVWTPSPPAPRTAEAGEVAAFMADERFAQLSSQQREQYVREVGQRYLRMTPEQRQDFDRAWKSVRGGAALRRQVESQMAVTMLRHISGRYFDLPEAERERYLDRVIMMLEFSDSPMRREYRRWVEGNPLKKSLGRTNRPSRNVRHFRENVLAATNASERARFYRFASDLFERGRQRR